MSILELIQAAEQKAEAKRLAANEQVKNDLETTRIKSEEEAKTMHSQALASLKKLEAKFEQEIATKTKAIDQEALVQDDAMIKKAKKQFKAATDYVLKRVIVK